MRWKVAGAACRPNGRTLYCHWLLGLLNAVFSWAAWGALGLSEVVFNQRHNLVDPLPKIPHVFDDRAMRVGFLLFPGHSGHVQEPSGFKKGGSLWMPGVAT